MDGAGPANASPFTGREPAPDSGPRTRAEAVAARIRAMITSGELPPGTRLRQVELAAHFGVSTTPVREAFTSLAREGFVRQDAHRGVEVFRPTVEDVQENYEIRLALEPLAAELAAVSISEEGLLEVERLMVAMENTKALRLGTDLNREFHLTIYRAANRPQLLELIARLRRSADAYVQLLVTKAGSGYMDQVLAEHREIYEGLRAHSRPRVRKAMTRHLKGSVEQIRHTI